MLGSKSSNPLSDFLLSPLELTHLYWCSFRSPLDEFIGVVICKGKSPGSAANRVIKNGIVEAERASIVMIPVSREGEFLKYEDRLLNAEESEVLLGKLGIRAVLS